MIAKSIFSAILAVAAMATPAMALDNEELLALIALPLVVDEVSDMTGVPEDRLASALATFAGADLRPTRYLEVVQYTPVALAYDVRSGETDFVTYVRDIRNDGLVGDPFYDAVSTHYVDTYGIPRQVIHTEPVYLRDGRTMIVEERLVSPVVYTVVRDIGTAPALTRAIITDANWSTSRATSLELDDLLALMAMPLIANEVAEVAGVPQDRVMAALAAFAGADLRPTRYIEVVQYAPVALAYDQRTGNTDLIRFVSNIRNDGLVGDRFYDAVTTYYVDSYGIPREVIGFEPLFLRDEPTIVYQDTLLSPVVRTVVRDIRSAPSVTRRVVADANWSAHPHGGPPGQLKKRLGLQTGAEVVHGTDRVQRRGDDRVIIGRNDDQRERGRTVVTRPARSEGQDGAPAQAARSERRADPSAKANRGQGQSKAPAKAKPAQGQGKHHAKAKSGQGQAKSPAKAKSDDRDRQKGAGGQGKGGNKGKGNKKDDGGAKS